MADERKQLNRGWLWLGAILVLVLVFFAVRSLTRGKLPVRAATVTQGVLRSTISTNGRVEPEENYQLHSPLATTVKAVYVQPGDTVAKGKLLMVLDGAEARARVAAAQSGVKSAEAALEAATHNGTMEQRSAGNADLARAQLERDQAQRDLDALVKLQASGAASGGEVSSARQRLATAEASLHAAQQMSQNRYSPAEVERARAALADAKAALAAAVEVQSKTEIRAPIAGTVYSVSASATEFAEDGKTLIEMADLHNLRVRAYFDEPEIGKLALGQQVQIKWDAMQGRLWHGAIERTPITVVTYGTRTVGEVLIKLTDADGQLLPETNVNVTVTTSSQPDALNIPREALYSENGQPYVYKLKGDKLVKTQVKTGNLNLTQVAIVSGLQAGDQVATGTTSGQPLQADVPIRVVE